MTTDDEPVGRGTGRPADGHYAKFDPRYKRCGAMRSRSKVGARCSREALPDTDPPRCEIHLNQYETKEADFMHSFYKSKLRPAMAEQVTKMIENVPVVEQLDVSGELALIRHQAGNFVEVYSATCEAPDTTMEMKVAAGALMVSALQDALKAVDTMARVEEVKIRVSGAFSGAMASVIACVVAAANEVFQDDHRAREFEDVLRRRLEDAMARSASGIEGTDLMPGDADADVREMDAMVPRIEE